MFVTLLCSPTQMKCMGVTCLSHHNDLMFLEVNILVLSSECVARFFSTLGLLFPLMHSPDHGELGMYPVRYGRSFAQPELQSSFPWLRGTGSTDSA